MSSASLTVPTKLPDTEGLLLVREEAPWREFARAPLVPVALAATAGLLLDRYGSLPLSIFVLMAAAGLIGWFAASARRAPFALPFLWLAFGGLAAAFHHTHRHNFAANDIGELASLEPSLVRLRGVILDEPITRLAPRGDPFAPHQSDRDATILRVTELRQDTDWNSASGLVNLSVERDPSIAGPALAGLHAGDAMEVVGLMARPRPPANPGEADFAAHLLDLRIRAEVRVSDSSSAVTRLDARFDEWPATVAAVRGWAARVLTERLAEKESPVARALLLGDTAAMDRQEWDAYVRTGVVHALAISGQHLVVLAGFVWLLLRAFGVRRSRGAWAVMLLVVGYAILTGLRPSGVRAAVMVAALCGGMILRRPALPANAFALSWLVVIVLQPTDPFSLGCQLSFLSVFVMTPINDG